MRLFKRAQRPILESRLVLNDPDIKVVETKIGGQLAWWGFGCSRKTDTEVSAAGSFGPQGIGVEGTAARGRKLEWKFFYDREKMTRFASEGQLETTFATSATFVSGSQVGRTEIEPLPKRELSMAVATPGVSSVTTSGVSAEREIASPQRATVIRSDPLRGVTIVTENTRGKEIFLTDDDHLVRFPDTLPPQEMRVASEDLLSILPEGSADKPRGLWVDTTVRSHIEDLKTLSTRLKRRLWVDSIGSFEGGQAISSSVFHMFGKMPSKPR